MNCSEIFLKGQMRKTINPWITLQEQTARMLHGLQEDVRLHLCAHQTKVGCNDLYCFLTCDLTYASLHQCKGEWLQHLLLLGCGQLLRDATCLLPLSEKDLTNLSI